MGLISDITAGVGSAVDKASEVLVESGKGAVSEGLASTERPAPPTPLPDHSGTLGAAVTASLLVAVIVLASMRDR